MPSRQKIPQGIKYQQISIFIHTTLRKSKTHVQTNVALMPAKQSVLSVFQTIRHILSIGGTNTCTFQYKYHLFSDITQA
jgi:hypothetical protein